MSYAARAIVPQQVLFREVGDESAIVNLERSMYFGLDEVGTSIWKALTSSGSIEEAFTALLDEYEVEPSVLRQELDRLLVELMGYELLELEE